MFTYIASPYTNNPEVNFKRVELIVAQLLKDGQCIFSPIVHCHEIAQKHNLPKDFKFWEKYNFNMLIESDLLLVIQLPGWQESVGVQAEIKFAKENKINILYTKITESGVKSISPEI